jgi:hypothetical protein
VPRSHEVVVELAHVDGVGAELRVAGVDPLGHEPAELQPHVVRAHDPYRGRRRGGRAMRGERGAAAGR